VSCSVAANEEVSVVFAPPTASHLKFWICVVSGMALLTSTVGLDRIEKRREEKPIHMRGCNAVSPHNNAVVAR
jgi:hypothetical protein